MLWLLLALSYAFLHSLVSLLDKILLKNKNVDSLGLSSYRFIANSIIAGILLFVLGSEIIVNGASFWTYILFMSIMYTVAAFSYFFVMKSGDVSKVVPLGWGMTILFAFILSISLLKEPLFMNDIFGTILLVIGAWVILTNGKFEMPRMSKELGLIFIFGASLAAWGVISKPATNIATAPVLNFFMYTFTTVILVISNSIVDFKKFSRLGKTLLTNTKLLWFTILSSLFATVGTYLLFIALSVGNASEIIPVSRTIPLFTIIWGWLILKEKHSKIRFLGALLIVLGIFLIYY